MNIDHIQELIFKYSEGRKTVWNSPHAHVKPTPVCNMNIDHIQELILKNGRLQCVILHPTLG
jgi:hypothetical protein